MSSSEDPFRKARETSGTLMTEFNGESIPFVLRLKDLRKTVKDWETFSSDHPFQVVPHTEEKMRTMRQIPIEMDPPEHTDYRALLEPIFKRPLDPLYISNMEELIVRWFHPFWVLAKSLAYMTLPFPYNAGP